MFDRGNNMKHSIYDMDAKHYHIFKDLQKVWLGQWFSAPVAFEDLLETLKKILMPDPHPRDFDVISLGWSLGISIFSNVLPGAENQECKSCFWRT